LHRTRQHVLVTKPNTATSKLSNNSTTTDSKRKDTANNSKNTATGDLEQQKQTLRRNKSNLILSDDENDDGGDEENNATQDSRRSQWLCSICLAEYQERDEICWSQNPDCMHVFHYRCIEAWLLKCDTCPCCRSNFLSTAEVAKVNLQNSNDSNRTREEENQVHSDQETEVSAGGDSGYESSISSMLSNLELPEGNGDCENEDAFLAPRVSVSASHHAGFGITP
jgi:hypothetical protein